MPYSHRFFLLAFAVASALAVKPVHAQFIQPGSTTEPADVLQKIHGSAELGWFAVSDIYRYIADVDVAFNFGTWNNTYFKFRGGILTYIESTEQQGFQPSRFRGTLEGSANLPKGTGIYSFIARHQSYHAIDSSDPTQESYELYMLGYERPGTPDYRLTVGKYSDHDEVDYQWDIFAEADVIPLSTFRSGIIYTSGWIHGVTENGSLPNRDGFIDYSLELGIKTKGGVRYFTAYKEIHDINQFNGITDHQLELGLKYIW